MNFPLSLMILFTYIYLFILDSERSERSFDFHMARLLKKFKAVVKIFGNTVKLNQRFTQRYLWIANVGQLILFEGNFSIFQQFFDDGGGGEKHPKNYVKTEHYTRFLIKLNSVFFFWF